MSGKSDEEGAERPRPSVASLLSELRTRIEGDRAKAEDAINTLVRLQTAHGLAAEFLKRPRPYEDHALLAELIQERLLDRIAFIQKPPYLLRFYQRLLFAAEAEPTSVLEIGVKGGGSTAFWKVLFPQATVVGLDIRLQRGLADGASDDGVIYVEGDQADLATLTRIADAHGPFSVVIDDGSHRSDDQAATMRCLLPRMHPGGFYVVEDVHANLKSAGEDHETDYGADIWADFVATWFDRVRRGQTTSDTAGGQLALDAARRTDDLILAKRVLALRTRLR